MNAAGDPLAALQPLREPAAVGWWPPAPGWWVVAAAVLVGLALLAAWLLRRYRRDAYRRLGREALRQIRARFAGDGDAATCVAATNALLKAVALRAYPRRSVAAVAGEEWRRFLDVTLNDDSGFETELLAPYRAGPPEGDVMRHLQLAERWIMRHRVGA